MKLKYKSKNESVESEKNTIISGPDKNTGTLRGWSGFAIPAQMAWDL